MAPRSVLSAMSSQAGGVSFQFHPDRRERLDRVIAGLKAEGEIPSDATRSDVLRALAEDFTDDPDPNVLEALESE